MTNLKDFIWIFPVIGGILIIVSLLTPAAYFKLGDQSLWLIGYNDYLGWPEDIMDLMLGILIFSILLSVSILMIYLGFESWRGKTYKNLLFLLPIVIIICIIIWLVAIEGREDFTWQIYIPMFGSYAPFIGAGIGLIGGILSYKY